MIGQPFQQSGASDAGDLERVERGLVEEERRPDLRLVEWRIQRQHFEGRRLFEFPGYLCRARKLHARWTRKCSTSSASRTPFRPITSTGASASRPSTVWITATLRRRVSSVTNYWAKNKENGFDIPMAYFDLYVPKVAQGMNIRIGRYISLPDIEAQLAPNNYTYTPLDHLLVRLLHPKRYQHHHHAEQALAVAGRDYRPGCDAAPWTKDAKPP